MQNKQSKFDEFSALRVGFSGAYLWSHAATFNRHFAIAKMSRPSVHSHAQVANQLRPFITMEMYSFQTAWILIRQPGASSNFSTFGKTRELSRHLDSNNFRRVAAEFARPQVITAMIDRYM
jgi:hypothetical protein